MDEKTIQLPHSLRLDDRNKLTLTGVTDVHTFNEETLYIETAVGGLTVSGENLQVTGLSLETGNVAVEGKVVSIVYSDHVKRNGGLFSRVFG